MDECEDCGSENLSIEVDDDGEEMIVCEDCGHEVYT